jgi:hypothetical protein|tara:strand:- start:59 stop:379 length:321 start_codon:yes stop_codon:yes gene_type:complete
MNVLEGFHRLPINNLVGILCGMNVVRVFLGWRWIPMLWQPTDVVINSNFNNFTNNFGENLILNTPEHVYSYEDETSSYGMVSGSWSIGGNLEYTYECSGIGGSTDC